MKPSLAVVPFVSILALAVSPLYAGNLTPGWVELGPSGAIARVIMDSKSACPQIKLDDRTTAMRARVDNPSSAFPVRVCETTLPKTVKKASIEFGGQSQPLARQAEVGQYL
jgi:hypothetical protein